MSDVTGSSTRVEWLPPAPPAVEWLSVVVTVVDPSPEACRNIGESGPPPLRWPRRER